jgi:hypothetical protein
MNSPAQTPRLSLHNSFNAFTHEALADYLARVTTDYHNPSDVVLCGNKEDIWTRYHDEDGPLGLLALFQKRGADMSRLHRFPGHTRKRQTFRFELKPGQDTSDPFEDFEDIPDPDVAEDGTLITSPLPDRPKLEFDRFATTVTHEVDFSLDCEEDTEKLIKAVLYPASVFGIDVERIPKIRTVVIVDQPEPRFLPRFLHETAKLNVKVIFTSMTASGWCGNPSMPEPTDECDPEVDLIPVPQEEASVIEFVGEWGDETIEERTEWLFEQFIPMTEPCGFTGEADTRKSTLALTIAAAGSTGSAWFTEAVNGNTPFSTLYAGTEDSWASVALPRFRAAGGDKTRICRLPLEVKVRRRDLNGNPVELSTPFTLDGYMGELGNFIEKTNRSSRGPVKLVIWDPLISFFGDKDYTSADDSTYLMNKIKAFQEEHRVASLSIMHHNKTAGQSAKQRTSGSHRISDAHKMLWTFTLDEDDKSVTLITPTKKNLLNKALGHKITTDPVALEMPDGSSCEYGKVRYLGTTDKSTDSILQEKESPERGKQKELREAILDALKDGPQKAGKVTHDLLSVASSRTIGRCAAQLEKDGRMLRISPSANPKDITWGLPDPQSKLPTEPGGEF